ncbi:unnamed protein product [Paramecium pentaurelia]|uniref:Leucine-rich repeat protein n=1 Tax=Paramecium pentaurelia TaxID=43138 RepID=A0A8S1UMI7_9CILI|nr:unnamed protein product [Paramecium pentaurelia]
MHIQNHPCLQIRIKNHLKLMLPTQLVFLKKQHTSQLKQINHLFLVNCLKLQKKKTKNDILCYSQEFQDIPSVEIDERYRYLVKNGTIKKIENEGNIIFSVLQQIQGIWVCYRRPMERANNLEKLSLDYLDLTHMPLLEGEEKKLRILTYQHNRIQCIQNLVSLPNLLYLDLYDNQIKEIDKLKQIQKFKVLLFPKNQIRRIQNLDHLTKLEVLDLHSNRIANLEGLSKLKSLKIINVGNHLITKLEALEELNTLIELNIKMNQIENIDHLQVLPQLQKLFMSQNKINSFPCIFNLSELSLENNPIQTNKYDYFRYKCQTFETLKILDGKPIDQIKQEILFAEIPKSEPIKKKIVNLQQIQQQQKSKKPNQMGLEIHGVTSEFTTKEEIVPFEQIKRNQQIIKIHNHNYNNNQTFQIKKGQTKKYILQSKLQQPQRETVPSLQNSLTSTVAAQEDDILISIEKQWTAEYRRIQMLEKNNQFNKKSCLQHQLVEGGHAEVEDDVFLLIYCTASAMVLPTQNFSQIIQIIHFQYRNNFEGQLHQQSIKIQSIQMKFKKQQYQIIQQIIALSCFNFWFIDFHLQFKQMEKTSGMMIGKKLNHCSLILINLCKFQKNCKILKIYNNQKVSKRIDPIFNNFINV